MRAGGSEEETDEPPDPEATEVAVEESGEESSLSEGWPELSSVEESLEKVLASTSSEEKVEELDEPTTKEELELEAKFERSMKISEEEKVEETESEEEQPPPTKKKAIPTGVSSTAPGYGETFIVRSSEKLPEGWKIAHGGHDLAFGKSQAGALRNFMKKYPEVSVITDLEKLSTRDRGKLRGGLKIRDTWFTAFSTRKGTSVHQLNANYPHEVSEGGIVSFKFGNNAYLLTFENGFYVDEVIVPEDNQRRFIWNYISEKRTSRTPDEYSVNSLGNSLLKPSGYSLRGKKDKGLSFRIVEGQNLARVKKQATPFF